MMGGGFEIPGFTKASTHNDSAAWNQGGEIPFLRGGITIQAGGNAFINQSGARTFGNIQGGTINEFNVSSRRTSTGRASRGGNASGRRTSGSATSGGITIQAGGNAFINQTGARTFGNIQGAVL
jgi:hypothetical protein